MKLRLCKKSDLTQIKSLLKSEGLPSEDINEHLKNIIIVEEKGVILGFGAMEKYNKVGLFRSLVVTKKRRSEKIGSTIYQHIEDLSKLMKMENLYLLTETASEYFKKLGFIEITREEVPGEIKNTKQFSNLCPASATVMKKTILE